MAIMIPPEIPDDAPVFKKMIFETLKVVAKARDWIVLHGVEIPTGDNSTNSREIDFIILIPDILSVVCLEVVTDKSLTSPLDDVQSALEVLRNHYATSHFHPDSPLSLGYAVAFPDGVKLKEEEPPKHLASMFQEAELPAYLHLMTGTSDERYNALDPDSLGVTLTSYAVDLTKVWEILSDLDKLPKAQITLDDLRSDLVSTGTTIARIFHYNLETGFPQLLGLTDDQLKVLQLVGCPPPSTVLLESSDQLNLESKEVKPHYVIKGPAGTGKTVLALELAKQRCRQGDTVALLCCNPYLSHRFESWAKTLSSDHDGKVLAGTPATLPLWAFGEDSTLKDKHQQRLTASPNLEGSLKLGYLDTGWPQFINDTIVDLEQVIDHMVGAPEQKGIFDYLVVDEAQNLCAQVFLRLMDKLLKGGLVNGKWSMFGDFDNQDITSAHLTNKATDILRNFLNEKCEKDRLKEEEASEDYWEEEELKINCRNTHEIASTVAELVRIKVPSKSGVHGPLVQMEYFESKENLGDQLDSLISDLKENRGFSSQQIILLTSTKHDGDESDKFDFDTNRAYGGWELLNISEVKETAVPTDTERILRHSNPDPNTPIRYSDVYDFQGLESDVAILVLPVVTKIVAGRPILPKYEHRRRLLYTGMSRAKAKLIILAQEPYRESLERPGLQ